MLLDETFRIDPKGSRHWQYPASGVLLLLGAVLSLLTLQPGRLPAEPQPASVAEEKKPPVPSPAPARGSDKTPKASGGIGYATVSGVGPADSSGCQSTYNSATRRSARNYSFGRAGERTAGTFDQV